MVKHLDSGEGARVLLRRRDLARRGGWRRTSTPRRLSARVEVHGARGWRSLTMVEHLDSNEAAHILLRRRRSAALLLTVLQLYGRVAPD